MAEGTHRVGFFSSPSGWAGECLSLSVLSPWAPGRRAFPGQSCCACAVRMQMERLPATAKHTTWQERAAMQTFTGQGRGFTPAAWDTQETSQEDAWLLLEDVSPSQPLPTDTLAWKAQVAQALAALHGDNLSRPGSPALLPPPKRAIGSGSPQPFPWTTSSASASRMGRSPGATAAFCLSCTSGGSALSGRCWPSAWRKPPSP